MFGLRIAYLSVYSHIALDFCCFFGFEMINKWFFLLLYRGHESSTARRTVEVVSVLILS